jgi:hypothetical protein
MASVRQRLRQVIKGGLLLRELRGVHRQLARIADALETYNAHQWPQQIQPDPDQPGVEVSYVDTLFQQELVDIEMRLTAAVGIPPSEDQILAEYVRRHPDSPAALHMED